MSKTSGISIPPAVSMRLVATRSDTATTEDSGDPPIAPRGMAAAPSPRDPHRLEADVSRPATIRIEAAVRSAPPRRGDLEHALDRAQAAVANQHASFGRDLNVLMLSQGLLVNAFVILLVFGGSSSLPGWRLLLGGLALTGAVLAGLVGLVLRAGRDAVRAPRKTGRARAFGLVAVRALPATFIAGWIALALYALALPPSATASEEARLVPQATEPTAVKETAPPPSGKRSPFNS